MIEGHDEETDLDETDRNWMIGDMAEDDSVKFDWSHYDVGDGGTVHVDTDYEAAIRRKRNLIYRDVGLF